ncbi:MAG TPA: DUF177 domain-containing protein [Longimicrobiaceae bacterium]|nr:DUF177 domain-containing protein [Longimicrobiaceae bacterium]
MSLAGPLAVDLTARSVGEGVFVRGTVRGKLRLPCRRCLAETEHDLDETVDFLFDELEGEEEEEMGGEVYPLPVRGDELDLADAVREQVLLRVPQYVVCREECRGLCPRCGADLNQAPCDCGPEEEDSPWGALRKIKFD